MVLHSGGIPKELIADDFNFLKDQCKVSLIYGTDDEYLNAERMQSETKKVHELFDANVSIIPFDGKHVVNVELINNLV